MPNRQWFRRKDVPYAAPGAAPPQNVQMPPARAAFVQQPAPAVAHPGARFVQKPTAPPPPPPTIPVAFAQPVAGQPVAYAQAVPKAPY